jgi:hypothetical protein
MNTIKQIQAAFAATINKEVKVNVEATECFTGRWCLCGSDSDARKAADWLVKHIGATIHDIIHDEEIGETFAYVNV